MGIVKRASIALVLLAFLGVAACGKDEPGPAVEIPSWAKVAPEQIAEAKKHGAAVAFENDLGMRFVLIPAETFTMGSPSTEAGREGPFPERESSNETPHRVTLSRAFYVQINEATVGTFAKFAPQHRYAYPADVTNEVLEHPISQVDWATARSFAAWVGTQDAKRTYRLPTEAEWEYACRAGTATPFSFGATISAAKAAYEDQYSYPHDESQPPLPLDGPRRPWTKRVRSYEPNPWGLYDMHGNVWEWCADWYQRYPPGPATDPTGPPTDPWASRQRPGLRITRGGGYGSHPEMLRSAYRKHWHPKVAGSTDVGFRLVSPLPEK